MYPHTRNIGKQCICYCKPTLVLSPSKAHRSKYRSMEKGLSYRFATSYVLLTLNALRSLLPTLLLQRPLNRTPDILHHNLRLTSRRE